MDGTLFFYGCQKNLRNSWVSGLSHRVFHILDFRTDSVIWNKDAVVNHVSRVSIDALRLISGRMRISQLVKTA